MQLELDFGNPPPKQLEFTFVFTGAWVQFTSPRRYYVFKVPMRESTFLKAYIPCDGMKE